MKLDADKLTEIATGAVRVEEENGLISLKRFTLEQEELYKNTNQDFYNKTFSTAGIKLWFKTDSRNLFLKLKVLPSSSRKYFSVDVFSDGKLVGCIDNFSFSELPYDYTKTDCPMGDFSKHFELGTGIKTVCVHLPWSVRTFIEEVSLDDSSFVEAEKQKKKLIAYGDSITHGYDALRPSNRYVARLADMLGAEEFNKGIGGERFFPELAQYKDLLSPDYITVAYGTNDWNYTDGDSFGDKCKRFYAGLSHNYPNSKIFAITPIWRKDMHERRPFGDFMMIEEHIRNAVADMENISVISGFDLVPKNEKYFGDLRLHPNDDGFFCYAENLYKKIKTFVEGD